MDEYWFCVVWKHTFGNIETFNLVGEKYNLNLQAHKTGTFWFESGQ